MIEVRGLELPEVIRDPLGAFVHRLRRSLPAEEVGDKGLTTMSGDQRAARELFNKGVALGSSDRQEEAIAVYTEVIKRFERDMLLQGQVIRAKELRKALRKSDKGDPKKPGPDKA